MMGPNHAAHGLAVGALAAHLLPPLLGVHLSLATVLLAGVLCAGAALVPDLDHPRATVAHAFGPASLAAARGLDTLGVWAYHRTRTRYDEAECRDGHRKITHTWGFPLVLGGLVATGCGWGGRPAVLAVLFVCLSLSIRGLVPRLAHDRPHGRARAALRRALPQWLRSNGWVAVSASAAGLTALASGLVGDVPGSTGAWLGAVVALGCLVHCWGDGHTVAGLPFWWPLLVRGQRWRDVALLPLPLRFHAGKAFERRVVAPLLAAVNVAVLADVTGLLWPALALVGL